MTVEEVMKTAPCMFVAKLRTKASNKVYSKAHKAEFVLRSKQVGTTLVRASELAQKAGKEATRIWRLLDSK